MGLDGLWERRKVKRWEGEKDQEKNSLWIGKVSDKLLGLWGGGRDVEELWGIPEVLREIRNSENWLQGLEDMELEMLG